MANEIIKDVLIFGVKAIAIVAVVGFASHIYKDYKKAEVSAGVKLSLYSYESCKSNYFKEAYDGTTIGAENYCGDIHLTDNRISLGAYDDCITTELRDNGKKIKEAEKSCQETIANNIAYPADSIAPPKNTRSFIDSISASLSSIFGVSTEDLANEVKQSIALELLPRGISVNSFQLVNKGGNEYMGVLKTTEPYGIHTYTVAVIYDGSNYSWQILQ